MIGRAMRLVACWVVLTLAGCASSAPPEPVSYLLRASQASVQRVAVETPRVGIGQVIVAPYLQQSGIVLETAPGVVRSARFHFWAEPFDQGIRHYLGQSLSNAMGVDVDIDPEQRGSWDYRLDVRFEVFHGSEQGKVRMTGEYTWTDVAAGQDLQRRVFADEESLSRDGYGALVAAHEILLSRLAQAMAEPIE